MPAPTGGPSQFVDVYNVTLNTNTPIILHGVRRISATAKTCWHPGAVRLAFTPRRSLRRSDFGKAA